MKYQSKASIWKHLWLKVCLSVLALPSICQAVVLDWSDYTSLSWSVSGGTYSTSIDFDPDNAGDDITITISGDTEDFLSGYPYSSPGVNSIITGGEGSGEESLLLAFNWNSDTESVSVTFDFHYADGIENLEVTLFDVDRLDNNTSNSGFRDYITDITGSYEGGASVIPNLSVEDSDYTQIQSAGKSNQRFRGRDGAADNSDNANAYIDYGTNAIDRISFEYGNHSSAPNNPGQQGIGIYDISFDRRNPKVPETGTTLAVSLLCVIMVGVEYLRRRQQIAA